MPIVADDLKQYLGESVAEDDVSAVGGAIQDTDHVSGARRPISVALGADDAFSVVSDGADTRTVTITGRLPTGVIDSEALVLTGATIVNGAKTFERILKVVLSAKDAARTVTVARVGGAQEVMATLGPNVLSEHRLNYDLTAEAGAKVVYEAVYLKNEHATLALTAAKVELVSHPGAGDIDIAVEGAVNSAASIANRETAPAGGLTFQEDGTQIAVPGGQLGPGDHIQVWLRTSLAGSNAAFKGTAEVKLSGSST